MRKHSFGKIKILLVLTAAVAISLCLVYVLKDNFRSPPQDKKEPGELSPLPAGEAGTEETLSAERVEGELICNKGIAQDLIEIFYELYCNAYRIEQVHLIDEYGGDDIASMEDNNTSCFNYRPVEGTATLSKHALGLAIDINPLYNPYVADNKDGGIRVSPETAKAYADRTAAFPYKIDEADICYRLFKEHGFTWGGNWKSLKDYQHFQKVLP